VPSWFQANLWAMVRRLRRIRRKVLRMHRRGHWDAVEMKALLDEAARMRPANPAKVQRFVCETTASWFDALMQFKRRSKVWPIRPARASPAHPAPQFDRK
jgi:hypothetical protein